MPELDEICLDDPEAWSDIEKHLAEIGVVGDIPLAYLFHKIEGLPESHPIMLLIRHYQQVGTAVLRGHELIMRKQDGSDERPLDEEYVALGKLITHVYGEVPLGEDEKKPVDPNQPVVHREWRSARPHNGQHWWVSVFRQGEGGSARYTVDCSPTDSPDRQRLHALTMSIAIRKGGALLAAEEQARQMLKGLVSEEQWASYVLNDAFYEKGKSGIRYLLRKNRPTLAFRDLPDGGGRPITALCFHPGGYYSSTWIGILPPSDEVIAHLLFIRGAEYAYLKQANHHALDDPLSGV